MSASHKFAAHGLDEKVSSSSVAPILEAVIEEAGVAKGCDKAVGNLLYTLATTFPKNRTEHRAAVSKLISSRAIRSVPQVNAAVKFVTKAASGQPLDQKALENACGAGVHTTPEQIAATVSRVLSENKATLTEERYSVTGKLLGAVNKELPWADGKLMKEEFDKQVVAMIGEMNDDDKNPQKKKEKAKEKEKEKDSSKDAKDKPQQPQESKESANKTGLAALFQVNSGDDDTIGRDLEWAHNTPAQRATHTKNTGGKIRTRFPPEPNGFLHLGHAKSMFLNFGIAKNRVGECILRFDDTNPTEEKQLYIDKVIEAALWLGHQPARVTYSSDYFEQLYELAVKLIKKGGAYVCHQTGDQMEESRKKHEESPWRNRTVEENLTMFENMRKGKYAEGHCTLRMKGDINHPMPCMWDLVAYRIKYAPHPHVGSKWCIYPSYDFTHCIIDSIEDIDFSICTLEFETRRESYFWLLHELDLYKPKVWEFSRLNLEYNVMSKRKLKQLVEEGHVKDWDDPRLLTLMGLRRRGLTPEIINNFCSKVGVSRNDNLITQELFDFCAREYLNEVCPRRMVVNDPVRVTLTNYPENKIEQFKAPLYPQRPASERGERTLPFTRTVYIDREDFRKEDEKGYFRLAPGKTVRLLYSYLITCTDFKTDQAGNVTEILATVDLESNKPTADSDKKKIKGNLHWVSAASVNGEPLQVELRLYDRLFTERDTNELKDDWRAKINPNSLVVKRGLAEAGLAGAKTEERFQFERVGFFCVDPDTTKDNLVFNLTVSLRDSKGKD